MQVWMRGLGADRSHAPFVAEIDGKGVATVLVNSGFQRDDAHGSYEAAGYAAKGVSFRKKTA